MNKSEGDSEKTVEDPRPSQRRQNRIKVRTAKKKAGGAGGIIILNDEEGTSSSPKRRERSSRMLRVWCNGPGSRPYKLFSLAIPKAWGRIENRV